MAARRRKVRAMLAAVPVVAEVPALHRLAARQLDKEPGGYAEERTVEVSRRSVRRVRRVPMAVELAEQLGDGEVKALLWYRDRYDAANVSPLRDSLDRDPRGSGDPESFRRRLADARAQVRYAEQGVAACLLPTLRLIALDDWTPTEVARERWGIDPARKVSAWRRTRVLTDFKAGAAMLLKRVGARMN